MSLMNKKNAQVTKQLNAINVRMEKLTNKMNKEYNACIQELLSLSTVLQNLEDGFLSTNEMLLKK
jgi:signal transduction histidine kinase